LGLIFFFHSTTATPKALSAMLTCVGKNNHVSRPDVVPLVSF
jgi:hypothetical protein